MRTTIATIHFKNRQWVETRIDARREFDAYCELEGLPSVSRVTFKTNDVTIMGKSVNGRPDVLGL